MERSSSRRSIMRCASAPARPTPTRSEIFAKDCQARQRRRRGDQQNYNAGGNTMGAHSRAATIAASFGLVALATPALADASTISNADTAWMIVATALVLMMTIP